MKEYIRHILERVTDQNLGRLKIREYLQARLLQILQDNAAFMNWAFVGGTALRFLYFMPRFSEDLDFSLVKSGAEDHFQDMVLAIKKTFEAEDYQVNLKVNSVKTVKNAFIKFEGLLFESGYSQHRSEIISIKMELDTNPPEGAHLTSTIIRKHVILNLQHYDKSSLLAGKLHALLSRRYIKGRDVYDLFWYLSDRNWPQPNIAFLNNALQQTGWQGEPVTIDNWRKLLREKFESVDWERIVADVRPFLEHPEEIQLLNKANLIKLLTETPATLSS